MKYQYTKYKDDILNRTMYAMVGHAFNTYDRFIVRIFVDYVRPYVGFPKERRYFPQIDDNEAENVYPIGDDRQGFKRLEDAKEALGIAYEDLLRTV